MATQVKVRFTGGDALVGFQAIIHGMFMANEAGGGYAAYEISRSIAKSGYSYGPNQADLKANGALTSTRTAREFFEEVLSATTADSGLNDAQIADIVALLPSTKNFGEHGGLSFEQKAKIDAGLRSPTGQALINGLYEEVIAY